MIRNRVAGEKKGEILIYALSTCVWCRKVKDLLNSMKVEYDYIDVDAVPREEKQQVMDEMKIHNPQCSFPTVVINNSCIVGFKEDRIREALKNE
ncbi:MAG: glutaredoxin family protein [Candidatus Xenobiia bacterium LiM19]